MDLIKDLFKGDKYIWGIFLTLFVISIVESFSATSFLAFRSREHYAPAMSHITILIFGFIAVFIVMNLKPHFFRVIGRFLLYVSILLLFIVLFMPKVNGASRYLLGFQPSELAKFALVTVVSSILAHGQTEDGISKDAFRRILIYSLIVCGLIFPENFSTSALLGATIFFLMFIARVQLMRILKIMGVGILAGILFLGVLYFTPEQYLKGRMLTWKLRIERSLDDEIPKVEQKIDDKNRQVQYGHMAVANGGILGKGPEIGRAHV